MPRAVLTTNMIEAMSNLLCKCLNQAVGDASLESRYFLSLLLEPNSLLLLRDDMYKTYLHGIAEREKDVVTDKICNLSHLGSSVSVGGELTRTTRVSLTIRYVPKTLKLKFKFGK